MSTKESKGKIVQLPVKQVEEQPAPVQEGQLVEIPDLNTFIGLVVAWHQANIEMLHKMRDMPGDGGMTVTYEEKEYAMAGDLHKGFLMGLTTAMGMFNQLPFAILADEDVPAQPTH